MPQKQESHWLPNTSILPEIKDENFLNISCVDVNIQSKIFHHQNILIHKETLKAFLIYTYMLASKHLWD